MRTEIKYKKVVNYDTETKEITVLDYIFNHGNNFNGAVGTKFEPVSKDDFYYTINPYLNDDKELLIYMAENFGNLTREMIENVDSSEEALMNLFFDLSYTEMWDELREVLNLDNDEAYIFNCTGGGRCFNKDFQGNINPKLSRLIRNAEK